MVLPALCYKYMYYYHSHHYRWVTCYSVLHILHALSPPMLRLPFHLHLWQSWSSRASQPASLNWCQSVQEYTYMYLSSANTSVYIGECRTDIYSVHFQCTSNQLYINFVHERICITWIPLLLQQSGIARVSMISWHSNQSILPAVGRVYVIIR